MKIYTVLLALLLIPVGCEGANSAAWEASLFTRTCSDPAKRLELYKNIAGCTKVGALVQIMEQDSQKRYAPHTRTFFVQYPNNKEKSLINSTDGRIEGEEVYVQHGDLPVKTGTIFSARLVVTQPDGTRVSTIWKDTFKEGLIRDTIEPQGKPETVTIQPVAAVPPVTQPTVSQAQTSSSFFTTQRLAVALLAGAVFVYQFREPIKKTLAKLAQGAQKVKILAH